MTSRQKTFIDASDASSLPTFDLSKIALLLDVDGTLIELAAKPDEVSVPEDLRSVLKVLSDCPHCALALVSGRPAAQLDALFAPLKLALAGCHGAEIRTAPDAPLAKRVPLDNGLRRDLYALASRFPGTLLEDKGYSIAMHFRANLALEAPLLAAANEFVALHPGLEVLAGKAVIEFKPKGYDKASACAELLQATPFAGRMPVFLGDDVTDEVVFRMLPEFSGIGISVGRTMEGAQYMLRSPAMVRSWLRKLTGELVP
jgi:trehalose 6-phosphate phosphatase